MNQFYGVKSVTIFSPSTKMDPPTLSSSAVAEENGQEENDGNVHHHSSSSDAEEIHQESKGEKIAPQAQIAEQKQQQQKQQQSSSSNPLRTRLGRFHIQPLRGALGGLTSLWSGRGKGRKASEGGGGGGPVNKPAEGNGENEPSRMAVPEAMEGEEGERNGRIREEESDENGTKGPLEGVEERGDGKEEGGGGEERDEEEAEILQPVPLPAAQPMVGEGENGGSREGGSQGSGPVPKPRRRLRRGSIVHPLEGAGKASEQTEVAIRPRSLSARKLQKPLEPSRESEWIYVQMPDRTFKRTTEAELQSRKQTMENGQMDPANLPEFASVKAAISVQSAFHSIAILFQGFLSGLAFGHAAFVWALFPVGESGVRVEWFIHFYSPMAIPVQTFFYICLTVATVDSLDRFELSSAPSIGQFLRHSFISAQFVAIFCCFGAFLASISCAQVDEYFARNDLNTLKMRNWHLLLVWRLSSAVRAAFCLLGWLFTARRASEKDGGGTHKELWQMIENPSNDRQGKMAANEGISTVLEEKADDVKIV